MCKLILYAIRRGHFLSLAQVFSLGVCVVLILLGSISSGQGPGVGSGGAEGQSSIPQPASAAAGAQRCKSCHAAAVEGYARSAMAHSLRRAGQEPEGKVEAHGTAITIHSSPAGYWQRWENGGDKTDYRVDYVIGSGNHASGYLVDIGGHLFQSPIAYYQSRKSYDLAPGYENTRDPDFTRPVSEECLLCHSGSALHVPGTLNEYRSPAFVSESITCERCHGPVEKHLANPRAGTIVNPSKLEPAARDSICEQCHLFGAARVPNPGRKLGDFVPGQRLEETFTTYRNTSPANSSAGDFKVISHVEQLALSVCARKSGNRLWCGTCHNPHDQPTQPRSYYRSRCLSCHASDFAAPHPSKQSDCLSCHMPRRDARDGGHTAFTDHRIQRHPETLLDQPSNFAITAWREPSPDLRKRNLGIAYIDVGTQRHSSALVVQGYRALTEVQHEFADDPELFKWLGEALLLGKQTSDAKFAFERALQLDPNSPLAEAAAASPYMLEGDAHTAIAHLERALQLDPLNLAAASTLIDLYEKQGKTVEAAELSGKIKTAMSGAVTSEELARNGPARSSARKAGEVFKNIQILKDVPSGQLISSMQFITSSLGVPCTFCHVEGHFDKDDKKPKQTARAMMRMTLAINKSNFAGDREVTCYSCHRGTRSPGDTPNIDNATQSEINADKAQELPTGLPSAARLLENYVRALGGSEALEKIQSRIELGMVTIQGRSFGIEIFTPAPEKQTILRHLPEGDSVTTFDGLTGWISIPGRPVREMQEADIEVAQMDADLQFATHIQKIFPELRVEYPEQIGGREAWVLYCVKEGSPPVKLYFDQQSGLLLRTMRFSDSPLGLNPTQTDYSDYRTVNGVQVAFRRTRKTAKDSCTTQLVRVEQNIPIDSSHFAPPGSSASPAITPKK